MSNIRSKDTTNTKDKIIKDKKETRVLNKNLFATNEAPKKETIRKNTKVKNKKSSDDHSSDSSELSEHNNFNESNGTVDEFMNNTKNIFTNILNTQAFDDEPKIKQKSKYPKDSELDINLNVDELVGNCDDFIHVGSGKVKHMTPEGMQQKLMEQQIALKVLIDAVNKLNIANKKLKNDFEEYKEYIIGTYCTQSELRLVDDRLMNKYDNIKNDLEEMKK
jgi:hypothetical protein